MGRTRLSFWLTRFLESWRRKPAYAVHRPTHRPMSGPMGVERLDDRRQPSATPFGFEAAMFGPPMHFRASEGLSDPRMGLFAPDRTLFESAVRPAFQSLANDPGFGLGFFCGTPWNAGGNDSSQDDAETSTEATQFSVRLISDGYTGETSRLVVTALDESNMPVRDYSGTVQLSSSDASLDLPDSYTFTAADRGTHIFEIEPTTAGELTITVTEVTADTTPEEPVVEEPVTEEPEAPVAEEPVAEEPVAEEPVADEIDTSEVDTVVETGDDVVADPVVSEETATVDSDVVPDETTTVSDDPSIDTNTDDPLPEETVAEETATDDAVAEETVTEEIAETTEPVAEETTPVDEAVETPTEEVVDDGSTEEKTTTETPVATPAPAPTTESDAAVSGSITFEVTDSPDATHFLIRTLPRVYDGEPTKFLVVALDESNRVVPNYNGTVTFTTTDGHATMPAQYTFTDADYGTHIFSARFETVGSQKITVTENGSASVLGTVAVDVATPTVSATDPIGRRLWRRWSRF
jgi:hypothetical protein